jgi:hypothetical protein
LVPDDNQWTEFWWSGRTYPGVFAGYQERPPLMRFYGSVPNGTYTLTANLYWNANLRYYWGYSASSPEAYSYDVTNGSEGNFAEYTLGTITVTNGLIELFVQRGDLLTGHGTYPYWGWAWIRLIPQGGSPTPTPTATSTNTPVPPTLTVTPTNTPVPTAASTNTSAPMTTASHLHRR